MFFVLAIGGPVFIVMAVLSSLVLVLQLVGLMEWHSWRLDCHLLDKDGGSTFGFILTWRACRHTLAGW